MNSNNNLKKKEDFFPMGGQSTACDIDFTKNNLCSTYKTKLFKANNLNDILI